MSPQRKSIKPGDLVSPTRPRYDHNYKVLALPSDVFLVIQTFKVSLKVGVFTIGSGVVWFYNEELRKIK